MSTLAILTKCPLAKCPLAKCPLAKCRLVKCPLAKCHGFVISNMLPKPEGRQRLAISGMDIYAHKTIAHKTIAHTSSNICDNCSQIILLSLE